MKICPPLDAAGLEAALRKFDAAKVALIGDLCLDYYIFADMRLSELSRETPYFPLPVVSERMSPGGAGNVACNVAALQPGKFTCIGLVGEDWRGDMLCKALRENGVDTDSVLRSGEVVTNTYVKVIRRGISDVAYEDPRIDFENRAPISAETENRLIALLEAADFDVLLVSDQMKFGCVTKRVREKICAIGATSKTVIVDSRDRAGEYENVIVKPNEVEAARMFGAMREGEDLLAFAARIVPEIARRNHAPAIVTLGGFGCMLFDGEPVHCPAHPAKPPIDIVGAGDTFLSAFGTAMAAGVGLQTAARIAALASSVTVRKVGTTGTASREELHSAVTE